jgi:urea transport system permease protein
MIRLRTWPVIFLLVSCMAMAFLASPAKAMSLAEMRGLVDGDTDQRIETLNKIVAQGDEKTLVFLQALADDAVKVAGDKIWIVRDSFGAGKAMDPLTGQKNDLPADAQDVVSNNRFRSEIETALAALKLFSSEVKMREQAAKALLKEPDASKLPILNKALAQEQDAKVLNLLQLAKAAAQLGHTDVAVRLESAKRLAESQTPETQLLLNERLAQETDAQVKAQLRK